MPVRVSTKPRCIGTTASGRPCNGFPVHGTQFCLFHLPLEQKKCLVEKRTTPEYMIAILERQLRFVVRDTKTPILARAQEIRQIIIQIRELQNPEQKKDGEEGKETLQKIRDEIA